MILTVLTAVAIAAVATDLAFNKIFNPLSLFALLAGVVIHWFDGGNSQALLSLVAAFAAGAIFLPFYIMGGMAAGDVKLVAGCAAIIGWPYGILAAGVSLICGTLLGIVYYVVRGGGKEFFSRYGEAAKFLWFTGRPYLPEAKAGSVARSRFPYALAIAAGSLITQLLVVPQ